MKKTVKTMDCLCPGAHGVIRSICADAAMRRRLQDLGLICGTQVECVNVSAHKDISVYKIRGACIAIRSRDAAHILLD